MKSALVLLLCAASFSGYSQNLETLKSDSNIHYCLAYLKKISSLKNPHYIAIIDDGTLDMENIEAKLFWSKRSVQDSIILHDDMGRAFEFNSPLDFLNFMYAHKFQLEDCQQLATKLDPNARSWQGFGGGSYANDKNYFLFRRRQEN